MKKERVVFEETGKVYMRVSQETWTGEECVGILGSLYSSDFACRNQNEDSLPSPPPHTQSFID